MTGETPSTGIRLNELLRSASLPVLDEDKLDAFSRYLSLLIRWNARLNLTSVRDADMILSRHFVESIACAQSLPAEVATLLDFGSGGGFPGIPIAISRPEIQVTLAESQNKKAAFLNEAVRTLKISARVHAARAATLGAVFDCVTLRAVDRMESAVREAFHLLVPGGWLFVMTTHIGLAVLKQTELPIEWETSSPLPGGADRIVASARKTG